MNFQDLLYTNLIPESTQVVSENEFNQTQNNYERFKNYVNNQTEETNQYINEDSKESDGFNINKTLSEPYPTNLKKNHYPLFDTYIQDISRSRFQKEKLTKISVNSMDRNMANYLYPNNFQIPFNKTYNNVQEIRLTDICIPNFFPPVNGYNNCLAWQYASKALLTADLIDDNIIPVPINNRFILYSSLPDTLSDLPGTESNNLLYETFLPQGYYTTTQLARQIKQSCSQVVHGCSVRNYLELVDRKIGVTTDLYPWVYPYEEPYYSSNIGTNTPTLMKFTIEPIRHRVSAVNRREEIEVLSIQTFEPGTETADLAEMDIYAPYVTATYNTFDPNYIYVLVKDLKSTQRWYDTTNTTPYGFPLVLTDLTGEIGGIPTEILNYTDFFDLNIYTTNGYTENYLNSISTYKLYDKIRFTDHNGVPHDYLRFALKLSSGNVNGRRNNQNAGWVFIPSNSETVIYNASLYNSIITGQTDNGYYGVNIIQQTLITKATIGSALLFRFIYDKSNQGAFVDYINETQNVKKRSVLELLAWPIPNNTNSTVVSSNKPSFSFIHSNTDGIELQRNLTNLRQRGIPLFYSTPIQKMKLQMDNGEYYFMSDDFIFIKISPTQNTVISNPMEMAIENINQQINQTYVNSSFFDTTIGGDYTCTLSGKFRNQPGIQKNYSNLFGKIIISSIPGNTESNLLVNSNFVKFYEKPIDNLSGIQIQILKPDMILYDLGRDFSFTIEIVEVIEVLKETLIDTKRDSVITQGYKRF